MANGENIIATAIRIGIRRDLTAGHMPFGQKSINGILAASKRSRGQLEQDAVYGYDKFLVMPDELRVFAWSAPMRDLAAKVGMSDVGLKKLLSSLGVPVPSRGHWNRVHAGKTVPDYPKSPARRPGEIGRVQVGQRFEPVLPAASPIPSSGPFASAAVPEDLEALHAQEVRAIVRVAVPRSLDRAHAGLTQILKQEDRRREKASGDGWGWGGQNSTVR